jgi:hypothetical protein
MTTTTLHPDLDVKEFVAKETSGYRLRIRSWKPLAPKDTNSIEFINESLNVDGTVADANTYNFFLSDNDVKSLSAQLLGLVQ